MKIENLQELVSTLSKQEIRIISNFYKSNKSSDYLKRYKLFCYILKNERCTKGDIIRDFYYGLYSSSAYSHLLNRLLRDILGLVLVQDSEKIVRSKNFSASLDLKKSLLYSEFLYRRGHTSLGDYFIDQGLGISQTFELPIEGLVLIELKRVRYGTIGRKNEISSLKFKSEKLLEESIGLVRSLSLYNDFGGYNRNQFKLSDEDISYGLNVIKELEEIYKRVSLAKNGFWYYRSAIFYSLQVEDYRSLDYYSKCLLKLTLENPSINSPVNVAGLNLEISEIYLLTKDYNSAKENIQIALSLFNPKLSNYLIALNYLFLTNFHLGQFEECFKIYEQAILHPKFKEKKDNVSIWNYYKTCLYFKKGLFKEALNSLNQDANALALNKSELFVFSRILYLFLLFETNKSILWSYELASFRKTFPSIKNYKIDRLKIVFFILNKLDKEDFDFPYVEARESEKFEKLQVIPNIWKPLGFELISFEFWFKEKTLAFNKTSKQKRKK
jgi:hypothetical protein